MTHAASWPIALSDAELLAEVARLVGAEREATAALVRSLGELDARRLYLAEGCSSLFVYCTRMLHLAEGAAYNRIVAARAARRFPAILEALARGSVTLTAVRLLAPHLTAENHERVLAAAHHRSKRDVEELVVALSPKPPAPVIVRRLPAAVGSPSPVPDPVAAESALGDAGEAAGGPREAPADAAHELPGHAGELNVRTQSASEGSCDRTSTAAPMPPARETPAGAHPPPRPAIMAAGHPWPAREITTAGHASRRPAIAPLGPDSYRIQLTVSGATHEKLRRAQDLLRHAVPSGDLATLIDRALTALLDDLDRRRFAATVSPRESRSPRPGSRHIPAAVRREVWRRDGGRCAFVGRRGRCAERGFLEFHHVEPHATGGAATAGNIQLRCRAHNAHEARLAFGEALASADLGCP